MTACHISEYEGIQQKCVGSVLKNIFWCYLICYIKKFMNIIFVGALGANIKFGHSMLHNRFFIILFVVF